MNLPKRFLVLLPLTGFHWNEVNISKETGGERNSFSWKMHPTLTLKIKVRVIISWAGGDSPFDSFKGIKGPPYKHPTVSAGQVRGLFPPSRVTKSYSACLNFNPQLPNKLRQRTGGLSRDHHQFLSNRTRCFVIYEWTFSPPYESVVFQLIVDGSNVSMNGRMIIS